MAAAGTAVVLLGYIFLCAITSVQIHERAVITSCSIHENCLFIVFSLKSLRFNALSYAHSTAILRHELLIFCTRFPSFCVTMNHIFSCTAQLYLQQCSILTRSIIYMYTFIFYAPLKPTAFNRMHHLKME